MYVYEVIVGDPAIDSWNILATGDIGCVTSDFQHEFQNIVLLFLVLALWPGTEVHDSRFDYGQFDN